MIETEVKGATEAKEATDQFDYLILIDITTGTLLKINNGFPVHNFTFIGVENQNIHQSMAMIGLNVGTAPSHLSTAC